MSHTVGHVWIAGAGPGDPALLTLAARDALRIADVVLYDALVNREILAHARPDADLRYVGKRAGVHHMTQTEINQTLIDEASRGKRVVRIKGGDPFVFGRGGEEALACRAAGLPFTVVPGISSAVAGLAYAGIPLTHRGLANSAFIATGMAGSEGGEVDWAAAAKAGTVVVLMGAARIAWTCEQLIAGGMAADTPAAAIANATLPGQQVVVADLRTLSDRAAEAKLGSPAIIVAGPAVGLATKLRWFEPGPLAGKRVAVTRSEAQSPELAALLERQGASVIHGPAISVTFAAPELTTDARVASRWDWVVFASANGVEGFFRALRAAGKDARSLQTTQVAAIGPSTRTALAGWGVLADFTPSAAAAETLGEELPRANGARILLPCGNFSDHRLADVLRRRQAHVERVEVYRTNLAKLVAAQLDDVRSADAITFASPSAANGLAQALGGAALAPATRLVSIGPRTSAGVRAAFGRVDGEAAGPTAAALVAAVSEALR
ncbi:MAG: uroporphyrinogen-III C-methyltransferase [Dehalococcoidia bacterium]